MPDKSKKPKSLLKTLANAAVGIVILSGLTEQVGPMLAETNTFKAFRDNAVQMFHKLPKDKLSSQLSSKANILKNLENKKNWQGAQDMDTLLSLEPAKRLQVLKNSVEKGGNIDFDEMTVLLTQNMNVRQLKELFVLPASKTASSLTQNKNVSAAKSIGKLLQEQMERASFKAHYAMLQKMSGKEI